MRKTILMALAIVLVFSAVNAQTNTFPSTGSAGVNTLSPLGNFQIKGDGGYDGSTALFLTNNATDYGRTSLILTGRMQYGNDGWTFGSGARNALVFAQNNSSSGVNVGSRGEDQYSLQLEGNSNSLGFLSKTRGPTPNLVLTQNGNIGLGTTAPRAFFDVANYSDNQKLSSILSRLPEGDTIGEGTFLGVRGYNTTNDYGKKSFALEHSFYGQINSSINFYRGGSTTGGEISFNTNTNAEGMRINALGNVGIGTATPAEKLSVNGKIRAHEIKVEAANWPDYVFDQDYKVLGLQELDAYIKVYKHLPEMPSAKEVEANGMALGELVKLQQKKIEELTLHLIDQNKKITTQNDGMHKQDEKIAALESLLKTLIKNH